MRIERLPSGKFETNVLILKLTMIAYNILRISCRVVLSFAESEYIQQRIKELHSKKFELENKLQTKVRKHKVIDTKPLAEPLEHWSELTIQEKHDVAAEMIEVIHISHTTNDIEIKMGI